MGKIYGLQIGYVMDFDSRIDTYEHINKVRRYLRHVVFDLLGRAECHDLSKLQGPEKEAFDYATPKLATTEYGSEEYRATLREIAPAVQLHYTHNSHHPEHYPDGIDGMSLLDLLEMLCDWKAAGERMTNGGDIEKSIEVNIDRFNISPQLAGILYNTAQEMGWI